MRKGGQSGVLLHVAASIALAFPAEAVERQDSLSRHASERKAPPPDDGASLSDAAPGSVPDGGGAIDAPSTRSAWPCLLVVDEDLRPFAELAWDRSATFRDQCRTLGAARATVIVRSASSRDVHAAAARISPTSRGTVLARVRVRVRDGADVVELIAHELEHVLECVEGINLLAESRRDGSGVTMLSDGAFESGRAIAAGRRVAREVQRSVRLQPD